MSNRKRARRDIFSASRGTPALLAAFPPIDLAEKKAATASLIRRKGPLVGQKDLAVKRAIVISVALLGNLAIAGTATRIMDGMISEIGSDLTLNSKRRYPAAADMETIRPKPR